MEPRLGEVRGGARVDDRPVDVRPERVALVDGRVVAKGPRVGIAVLGRLIIDQGQADVAQVVLAMDPPTGASVLFGKVTRISDRKIAMRKMTTIISIKVIPRGRRLRIGGSSIFLRVAPRSFASGGEFLRLLADLHQVST